ncbi:MAG: hypothetical protein ACPLUI_11760 [Desulfofundulus sp.]
MKGSPVWASNRLYRCTKCGNTRAFYGRTTVDATILVTAVGAFSYDVAEYTIDETDRSNHVITHCAECGSTQVAVYDVTLKPEPVMTDLLTGARRRIYTHVDPLPPGERDVVFTPDGQAVAASQRATNEILFAQLDDGKSAAEKRVLKESYMEMDDDPDF